MAQEPPALLRGWLGFGASLTWSFSSGNVARVRRGGAVGGATVGHRHSFPRHRHERRGHATGHRAVSPVMPGASDVDAYVVTICATIAGAEHGPQWATSDDCAAPERQQDARQRNPEGFRTKRSWVQIPPSRHRHPDRHPDHFQGLNFGQLSPSRDRRFK